MSFFDSLPLFSQAKSLVQVIGGDVEGARRTQENFSRRCPVVSQARSAIEAAAGNSAAAESTQREFLGHLGETVAGPLGAVVQGAIQEGTGHPDLYKKDHYGDYSLYVVAIPLFGGAETLSGLTGFVGAQKFYHFRIVHETSDDFVIYDFGGGSTQEEQFVEKHTDRFKEVRHYKNNRKGFILKAWHGPFTEARVQSAFETVKRNMGRYNVLTNNCQVFCGRMTQELTGENIREEIYRCLNA